MKTMANLKLKAAVLVATALCAGHLACVQAQNSPVGSWDFVLTGGQRGLMQLTFVNDFTITGNEIVTVRPRVTHGTDEEDARTPGGTHREFDANGTTSTTNIYGGASLEGVWTYDSGGRVIGVINELSLNSTNGISFRATVRPGVRVTMTGYRNGRRITYRGVPLNALASFAGNYYGTGSRTGDPFTELFTFTPGIDPNTYDVVGVGPAYSFAGSAIISAQRQIAFYTVSDENTNGVIRSINGSFNLNRGVGSLLGIGQVPGGEPGAVQNVRMTIRKQ